MTRSPMSRKFPQCGARMKCKRTGLTYIVVGIELASPFGDTADRILLRRLVEAGSRDMIALEYLYQYYEHIP